MTSEKALELLNILKLSYPNDFEKRTEEDIVKYALLWSELLAEYDDYIVEMAVKHYIKTNDSGFEPKIGNIMSIIKNMYMIQNPIFPEYTSVWNSVVEAITPRGKTYAQAFEELPQVAKEIIHDCKRLYEYGQMPTELVLTTIENSFRKSFNEKLNIAKKRDEFKFMLNQPLIQDHLKNKKLIEPNG